MVYGSDMGMSERSAAVSRKELSIARFATAPQYLEVLVREEQLFCALNLTIALTVTQASGRQERCDCLRASS